MGVGIKTLLSDMADFSLVQKFIAVMIIGTMLLAASYLYQKIQKKYAAKNIEDRINTEN